MSAGQIITRGAVFARSAGVAWVTLVAVAGGGCQLVLGDIGASGTEREPAHTDEEGGAAGVHEGDAGPVLEGARDAESARDAASGAADASGAGVADAAAASAGDAARGSDAGEGPMSPPDAGTPGAQDGSTPEADAALSCSQPGWWYADDDRDGYGRASSRIRGCAPPADGSWAETPGDCNDDDPRVHPDQADFFDAPYEAPGGASSFDYDCSGGEEGNNLQATLASDYCGLLALTLCTGNGYLPVRPGAPNPWCGSQQKATCTGAVLGALVCETSIDTVVDAYVCH